KWLCKVCNHKQSIKQFFGSGSAKDCRLVVQTLNQRERTQEADQRLVIGAHAASDDTDNNPHMDYQILDYLYATDDSGSNDCIDDDVSIAKKQKLSAAEPNTRLDSAPVFWSNSNQLLSCRGIRKWGQSVVK
ncbi:unnamed protein product, partial [Medioppia subpectinata]